MSDGRPAAPEPYDPLLYALVHAGTPGDIEFYLSQCQGAERVLELGCGFGRIAVALAEAGHEVVGLDLHEGLLELAAEARRALPPAQRQRLTLTVGDMRDFDFEQRFDRIVIPHSGLYCLLSDAEVEACLGCVRAHLAPGGRVVLDAYAADGFHEETRPEDHPDDQEDEVALIACEGTVYDVYERSRWDREAQRMLATYVYVPDDGGPRREYAIDQRYLLRDQLVESLQRCGLSAVSVCGDFQGSPYDAESELIAVVAERQK